MSPPSLNISKLAELIFKSLATTSPLVGSVVLYPTPAVGLGFFVISWKILNPLAENQFPFVLSATILIYCTSFGLSTSNF